MTKALDIFRRKTSGIKSVVITTHTFPDADGIGSEVGLCMAMSSLSYDVICLNEEPLLQRYKYLDPENVVHGIAEWKEKEVDLLIVTDTNSTKRIGKKMEALAKKAKNILYVDHHPYPKNLENDHCLDTRYAATGQLVGELILGLGVEISQKMALPLYTAILIDTNSFRYPTVSAETHRLVGRLLEAGLKPTDAYNGIYGTKKIQHMHMLGEVLASANSSPNGRIGWISMNRQLLDKYGTDIEDTHNFINHLLVLDSIHIACMFREDPEEVKLSMRSMGDVDVGILAQKLGGGGHGHSAATMIPRNHQLSFEEQIKQIVGLIEKFSEELDKED